MHDFVLGIIYGICFGASCMLLVSFFQMERVFKGWKETIKSYKDYHEAVGEYQASVNAFVEKISPMIAELEKMDKNQCEHPGEGAFACNNCGEKRW